MVSKFQKFDFLKQRSILCGVFVFYYLPIFAYSTDFEISMHALFKANYTTTAVTV